MARRMRLTTRDRTSRVDRLAAQREEGGEGQAGARGGGLVSRVSPPPQRSPLRHSGLLLSKPQGGTSEGTTFPGQWISRPGTIWIFLVVPL